MFPLHTREHMTAQAATLELTSRKQVSLYLNSIFGRLESLPVHVELTSLVVTGLVISRIVLFCAITTRETTLGTSTAEGSDQMMSICSTFRTFRYLSWQSIADKY